MDGMGSRAAVVTRTAVTLLASIRGVIGVAVGLWFVLDAGSGDWAWLVRFLGAVALGLGVVSLAQAAMVWSNRASLLATAALLEAGQLLLWLYVLPQEGGDSRGVVHLLIIASIVGLCASRRLTVATRPRCVGSRHNWARSVTDSETERAQIRIAPSLVAAPSTTHPKRD